LLHLQGSLIQYHILQPLKTHQFQPFSLLIIFLGGFALLFIIAPLAELVFSVSPAELSNAARDPEISGSVWLTLFASMMATLFFGIAAIPLAYVLARRKFRFRQIIIGAIDLPIVIPHTAAGIALLGCISRDTWLGKAASSFGINFVGTTAGIALAMAFVSIPFLINAAREGFAAVPERMEKVALTLGASPSSVFFRISVPMAWRSIVSGMVMMFARGMSEFGAVVIIAYHPMTAPVLIFERFGAFGLKYAQPAAVLFICVSLVVFIILRLIAHNREPNDNLRR
jgi:molybdate/tungstate transport system permease protein